MPWVKSRATKLNDQVSDSSGIDNFNSGLKEIQAGFFICQDYVPEKCRSERTQNPIYVCFLGVRGLTN